VYKWAGVLPCDVGRLSLWEFHQAVIGYQAAQGVKIRRDGEDVSEDQLADMGIEGF
jgi:hypothetical protein